VVKAVTSGSSNLFSILAKKSYFLILATHFH
jgi:hypothetical protein